MKKTMKKLSALMVLSLFLIGMVPAAFAQTAVESDIEPVVIDANSDMVKVKKVKDKMAMKLEKDEKDQFYTWTARRNLRDKVLRFKKVREARDNEIRDLKDKHDFRTYATDLRHTDRWNDPEHQKKALHFTNYVLKVAEKLQARLVRLSESDFVLDNPAKAKYVHNALAQFDRNIEALEGFVSDDEITRAEWKDVHIVMKEIRGTIKKLRMNLQDSLRDHRKAKVDHLADRLEKTHDMIRDEHPNKAADIKKRIAFIRNNPHDVAVNDNVDAIRDTLSNVVDTA